MQFIAMSVTESIFCLTMGLSVFLRNSSKVEWTNRASPLVFSWITELLQLLIMSFKIWSAETSVADGSSSNSPALIKTASQSSSTFNGRFAWKIQDKAAKAKDIESSPSSSMRFTMSV